MTVLPAGEGEEERDGGEGARNNVQRIRFEKKLQPYPLTPNSRAVSHLLPLRWSSVWMILLHSVCVCVCVCVPGTC